jgi:hypothetical protein
LGASKVDGTDHEDEQPDKIEAIQIRLSTRKDFIEYVIRNI